MVVHSHNVLGSEEIGNRDSGFEGGGRDQMRGLYGLASSQPTCSF